MTEEATDSGFLPEGGRRKRERRGFPIAGCLAVLVAFAILIGGAWFGISKGVDFLKDNLAAPEDYPGPGTGKVQFEVESGDTINAMGNHLKEAGVVKSVDAFTDAASKEPQATGIQVGWYELKKEMKAADALTVLINPDNRLRNVVTVPEGLRVTAIVKLLAQQTDFSRKQLNSALQDPKAIGLPEYADGNPEGYLFPATYELGPKETPKSLFKQMVGRWRQAAEEHGLIKGAKRLDMSPGDVMIVASLVEAEASRDEDFGKVARVIYNRLETKGPPTFGKLELDATIAYGLGFNPGVALTKDQLAKDTPYNSRIHPGLPPTPIEAPGDQAIKAALNPTDGPWLWYVTVDLSNGETKFTDDYDEFLRFKGELNEYCETSDAC